MGKAVAMEGLQRLEGYVRKHIGKQASKQGMYLTHAANWIGSWLSRVLGAGLGRSSAGASSR
jgi:hypothetical protein